MTKSDVEAFVAELDDRLQAVYRNVRAVEIETEDTLSDDFQVAASIHNGSTSTRRRGGAHAGDRPHREVRAVRWLA